MVITKLNEYFYETLRDNLDIEVLVFKTEKGKYSAEVLWREYGDVTASELMKEYKTVGQLKNELINSISDLKEIEIVLEEKQYD